jgi:hypothetical protein
LSSDEGLGLVVERRKLNIDSPKFMEKISHQVENFCSQTDGKRDIGNTSNNGVT